MKNAQRGYAGPVITLGVVLLTLFLLSRLIDKIKNEELTCSPGTQTLWGLGAA